MKVFISWSGKLSNGVAKVLSEWLPTIINSLEIFYSPDDIQKGENWDARLSNELSECDFGIICLTRENVVAPWINFEAGAISKELGAKVSALLIDLKPSEIRGPIKRFQATRFDKEDFYKLITGLNNCLEKPLESKILERSFNTVWDQIDKNVHEIIERNSGVSNEDETVNDVYGDAIQEILQIVRGINNKNIEKIGFSINKTYEKCVEILDEIEKRPNSIKNLDEKIDRDMLWIYTDAYRKIVSDINSLYVILNEERNDVDKDKYKSIHIETINGLSKRLENISYILGDDTINNGKILLEKCKGFLDLV